MRKKRERRWWKRNKRREGEVKVKKEAKSHENKRERMKKMRDRSKGSRYRVEKDGGKDLLTGPKVLLSRLCEWLSPSTQQCPLGTFTNFLLCFNVLCTITKGQHDQLKK